VSGKMGGCSIAIVRLSDKKGVRAAGEGDNKALGRGGKDPKKIGEVKGS